MFGPRAAWEGLKALLKVIVISVALIMVGRQLVPELVGAGVMPLGSVVDRLHTGCRPCSGRSR
jgi:flagellar biosynthetic protein FlhB